MIKIVAKMHVKADKVELFKATAKELVEKSAAEPGNVFYTLNVRTDDPTRFAMLECWKDQDAINEHNASEHFTTILPQLAPFMESDGEPVELYTEVEY